MANTINSVLVDDVVTQEALYGFVSAVAPLAAFSRNWAAGNDKIVNVPFINTDTAHTFAGDYTSNSDSTVGGVQVTIDQHDYVPVHLSDVEAADHSRVRLEQLGQQAGAAMARKVFVDVLNEVTSGNFADSETAAAAAFDSDVVVDIKDECDSNNIPKNGRVLVLASSHYNALLKDPSIKNANTYGSAQGIQAGMIPNLFGFTVYESTDIPSNSENLVGFAASRDALATAMRYLQPQDPAAYRDARPVIDAETGAVLGTRRWFEQKEGKEYLIYEANWGVKVSNAAGLVRLVSA